MHRLQALLITAEDGWSYCSLSRGVKRGSLVRLFRGVYAGAAEYEQLDEADQYRLRALAYLKVHPGLAPWGVTAAVLLGAPMLRGAKLHFQGAGPVNQRRVQGVVVHKALAGAEAASEEARIIYECAVSGPLAEALIAADFIARGLPAAGKGELMATRELDGGITDTLVRLPVGEGDGVLPFKPASAVQRLSLQSENFVAEYHELRQADLATAQAELLWFQFAALCAAIGRRRGYRQALKAGLYFTDLTESIAESLLVAHCVELGFTPLYLQVSICHPESGKLLGRVDGLWPTAELQQQLRHVDTRFGRLPFLSAYDSGRSAIIEFDGRVKYADDYQQVLERERMRRNAIGNLGFRIIRVNWEDLIDRGRLQGILSAANLPLAS